MTAFPRGAVDDGSRSEGTLRVKRAMVGLLDTPPPIIDWCSYLDPPDNPMGNDRYGNCVECADYVHAAALWARQMDREPKWDVTLPVREYQRLGDWQGADRPGRGTDVKKALADWAQTPRQYFDTTFPALPASVPISDDHTIATALARTGPLLMTLHLPDSGLNPECWTRPPDPSWVPNPYEAHRVALMSNRGHWTIYTYGDWLELGPGWRRFVVAIDALIPTPPGVTETDLAWVGQPFDDIMRAAGIVV